MEPLDRLRTALADRYAIEREIGRGGMAIVFLAHDLRHSRDVAIKVLRPEFSVAVSSDRFLREIQIEGRLKHPHILPLFDSGEADGLLYYVMPYIPGRSLEDRLSQEQQLPVAEALRITTEVGEALAHAHGHGIVHRDVKPGNILLDDNHAILADFGIARVMTELAGDRLSDSGLVIGTPEYMSPEQGSHHARLDGRSDIYALGCVLYEMLSGEPPFTGATAQAVIARHMHDSARSLRIVRPAVPEYVEEAIQVALAKVPADRYTTTREFIEAIGPSGKTTATRASRKARRKRVTRATVLGGVAIVGSLGIWKFAAPGTLPLDQNKVVLFPLSESGPRKPTGSGYDVAVMLSAALEHAQPLKWIDGAPRLAAAGARDVQPTADEFRRIARAQGAGFYIDGAVLGAAKESTTVVLRVHDTKGDSVLVQETATGPSSVTTPVQLGLQVATKLLPALVDPGRTIDLTPLSARKTSATALWIQGEREYRRSRFSSALGFYDRALREDSSLAFAAIKGAQAAGWEDMPEEAAKLLEAALAHSALLPSRQRSFAEGWQAYLKGDADSAVALLRKTLAQDPEWAEAHMALGEVYYHLLPSASPLDALAKTEFSKAFQYDSGFAPPLFHLAEIALRTDSLARSAALIKRFREFQPASSRWRPLALMQSCVESGPASVNWEAQASLNPMDLLEASRSLAVGGAQNRCAERGFKALLADRKQEELHWGAFLGLHGIAMSERRFDRIVPLIDSAVAGGLARAPLLYFLDVLAGAPLDAKAQATASAWRSQYGNQYEGVSPQSRWLVAAWEAHSRDTIGLKQLRTSLLMASKESPLPLEGVLEGHMALSRADTLNAVRSFRSLQVNLPADVLQWGLVEPLAVERLIAAEFALSRRDFAEAERIAAIFDHPAPVAYLPFVPASLSIRLQAARGLQRSDLVERYEERLRRLQLP
ncbi:MAG TPA: protein kinase, partial [Gemmatimonadales bacterium]|nr:protein kinase [Gemmatimonadales bacterium]